MKLLKKIYKIILKIFSNLFYQIISSLIISQIFVIPINSNEENIIKNAIITFIPITLNQWQNYSYYILTIMFSLTIFTIIRSYLKYLKNKQYEFFTHGGVKWLYFKQEQTISTEIFCPKLFCKLKLSKSIEPGLGLRFKCQKSHFYKTFQNHELNNLKEEVKKIIEKKYGYIEIN